MEFDDTLHSYDLKEVSLLLNRLKREWPRSILIYQWITNRVKWNDREPDKQPFSICSPGGDVEEGLVIFGRTGGKLTYLAIFNFKDDVTKLGGALLRTQRIPWNEEPICGVPEDLMPWFVGIKNSIDYKLHENVPTKYFWIPRHKAKGFSVTCPDDVYVEKLKAADSGLINDLWPHKFPGSQSYLSELLRLNYGYGVYSKMNGELYSWGFNYEYGDIGALQTVEKHQRKGYASLVIKAISLNKVNDEEDPYAFIVEDNEPSERLFKNLGFEYIGIYNWLEFTKND